MKKTQKGAAAAAVATLLAGAVGIAGSEAKAATPLGTGGELRGTLLRSSGDTHVLSEASPTPTPGKSGGEGKCGEGKCGGGSK